MSFLQDFFRTTKPSRSAVLIDVTASSVAGAYARHTEGGKSTVLHTRRFPIETRAGEPRERAMLRALRALGEALIQEGAPTLIRAAGRGTADNILVSIDAPWQETRMRTKYVNQRDSFLFTKELAATALEETGDTVFPKPLIDESIVGTALNGYETRDPYGKSATRASIVALTSYIDRPVSENIAEILRGLFHIERVSFVGGSSLRYQALRRVFTHERNLCLIDATGSSVTLALVHKDVPVFIMTMPGAAVVDEIKKLKERFSLPRTVFLLAPESEDAALRQALGGANAPRIVSILPSHLLGLVTQAAETPPDIALLLMAVYPRAAREETM